MARRRHLDGCLVEGLRGGQRGILLRDRRRQRLGEAARQKVLREFNLFKNAETLAQLFKIVATRGGNTFVRLPAAVNAQAKRAL